MYNEDRWLECQWCGERIRKLTPVEVQDISLNPYNYVYYCNEHRKEGYDYELQMYTTGGEDTADMVPFLDDADEF